MRLATAFPDGYDLKVTAKSVATMGLGRLKGHRRTSAPTVAGAFFVPAKRYGGCAWDTFGCAGFLCPRSANPRTVAPIRCLAAAGGDSIDIGVSPMKHARIASASRARAHRKMAFAALRSDSSAAVRLRRYNHHMTKARHLDGQEVRP